MVRKAVVRSYEGARKLVIALAGSTVVAIGIAMIVLPGPGLLVIPLGLGILALEFAWARSWLRRLRRGSNHALRRLRSARAA